MADACWGAAAPLEVAVLNRELLAWQRTHDTVRPHQALGYLTPLQFVTQWHHQRKEARCHSSSGRVHGVAMRDGCM
ncbi:MAG: transposase [Chloroflexi bacterium]|nr:transposase [Chloroflexota bacterium]